MPSEITAIGLMSGTSLDGIDVAVMRTDGERSMRHLYAKTFEYDAETRDLIRQCIGLRDETDPRIARAEELLTRAHAEACREALLLHPETLIIGFHGQTIWHAPEEGRTRQLGDAPLLADLTQRTVIYNFRQDDMDNGGQGAPLLPLYHVARAHGLPKPLAVLNIGGVANVTWIGEGKDDLIAFDTGPGNALLNDWVEVQTGEFMDKGGEYAAKGKANQAWVKKQLNRPYLSQKPPKSLDRQDFDLSGAVLDWSFEDGAATLTLLTAACVFAAIKHLPEAPRMWIITGGGRRNPTMMREIKKLVDTQTVTAEAVAWDGDALEAEGFAYLAVRSMHKLPLTLPQTTGCRTPTLGGTMVRPNLPS